MLCDIYLASIATLFFKVASKLFSSFSGRTTFMDHLEIELKLAWEELSFWRDFAIWWKAEESNPPGPRMLKALENAERRYTKVQQSL